MKGNSFKLFLCVVVVFMTMIACISLSGGAGQSAQPAQFAATLPPAQLPTVAAATQPPAQSGNDKYFQEDFNGGLGNWSQFVINGTKIAKGGVAELSRGSFGNMSVGVKDGYLVFDLESQGQWAYAIYDPQEYDDVRLDVSAENRGTNDTNLSLICRYTPDQGWYEFSIADTGLFEIDYAQVQTDGTTVIYSKLADGGYSKFKTGKDTNQIGISCAGRTLTLFINGNQVKQLDDNQYVLKSGKIGVAVASFTNPPAIVGFDWAKVGQPVAP